MVSIISSTCLLTIWSVVIVVATICHLSLSSATFVKTVTWSVAVCAVLVGSVAGVQAIIVEVVASVGETRSLTIVAEADGCEGSMLVVVLFLLTS